MFSCMTSQRHFLLVSLYCLFLLSSTELYAMQEAKSDEQGFVSLFNGKDLTGWQGSTDGYYVENGELICKPGAGGVLFTKEEYKDFEVRLEFSLPPGGNNGLAIRYPGKGRASVDAMCEIQILDDEAEQYRTLDPRQYTGAVYGMIAPKRGHLRPLGEWNEQRVIVRGSSIQIFLNNHEILNGDVSQVTEFKDDQAHPGKDRTSGFFGFAGHNDPVRFRNIRLKKLESLKLIPFSLDITIPLNHRCMGILPQKSSKVADPLYLHGFILKGPDKPVAVVALDWCEVRNSSYDLWRQTIASAINTTPDRVILSSLHQHDAPVIDHDAAALLKDVGLANELFHEDFHANVLQRLTKLLEEGLQPAVNVTDIGYSEVVVKEIASNRRIQHPDGSVTFSRGSSSGRDATMRQAPEGLIDPKLRTLSFWNGNQCLLEYHVYATHPMSYYGRGEVSSDFVGLARERRQRDDLSIKQIYASGCSGDVTAGKYNDGSPQSRKDLTDKLYQAMVEARTNSRKFPASTIRFQSLPLNLSYTEAKKLQPDTLTAELKNETLPIETRILAAMGLASAQRVARAHPIDMPCLDFGKVKVVLFPGEAFVGYQHICQEYSSGTPVIPIGYGECWTGYLPTETAFQDGFDESWLWVSKGSEERIRSVLSELLAP